MALRHFPSQQTVGADNRRRAPEPTRGSRMIEHQQMVADRVEGIDVAARQKIHASRHRRHFLVENLVAQPLRAPHVDRPAREPHLERTHAPQALVPFELGVAIDADAAERTHMRQHGWQRPGKMRRAPGPQ
jgi:hypothetical protein